MNTIFARKIAMLTSSPVIIKGTSCTTMLYNSTLRRRTISRPSSQKRKTPRLVSGAISARFMQSKSRKFMGANKHMSLRTLLLEIIKYN